MGIKDLYTIQGVEHIKALMDETRRVTPTSDLLQIAHQEHTLEIGRRGFIYDWQYKQVAHLMTETWIKHTLRFVSESNIRIKGNLPMLKDWREGDSMLMDDFATAPGHTFTKEDMIKANRCRQYLQVTTRSDIASGNGTKIINPAWRVEKEWKPYSSSAYRWPEQKRPVAADV